MRVLTLNHRCLRCCLYVQEDLLQPQHATQEYSPALSERTFSLHVAEPNVQQLTSCPGRVQQLSCPVCPGRMINVMGSGHHVPPTAVHCCSPSLPPITKPRNLRCIRAPSALQQQERAASQLDLAKPARLSTRLRTQDRTARCSFVAEDHSR